MVAKKKDSNRIEVLDGFRFIAILSVMLFHYCARWAPPRHSENLYPYNGIQFFNYGYLGVSFFFIISGFVITYTLQNNSFSDFWKKRMIRLLPAMVICSLLTFMIFRLCDPDNLFPLSHSVKNLFTSFTLISPELINNLFNVSDPGLNYISGSYWSLWPEIQFYALASILYYFNPKNFFAYFFALSLILYGLNKVISLVYIPGLSTGSSVITHYIQLSEIFNVGFSILWFLMGVLFFQLYSKNYKSWTLPGLIGISLIQIFDTPDWKVQILTAIMAGLFFLFIYSPHHLEFLRNKIFTSIGVVSYSLYLIHENIGVLLINKLAYNFGKFSVLFPVLLIAALALFSLVLYKRVEAPVGKFLKKRFT